MDPFRYRVPASRSREKENGRPEWGGIPTVHVHSAVIMERAAELHQYNTDS